jgi:hypothetical protein
MDNQSRALTRAQQAERLVELCKLIDKSKPKESDLAEFRRMLRDYPDLWRSLGDMGRQAEYKLINSMNMPASSREAMQGGLDSLRRDLGYSAAPALERLLIDAVAVAWLRLQVLELKHAHNTGQSIGIPQADYWDRTLSAAQRRYLRAVETLARVRRLLRPVVQVNVATEGGQQVNVAGDVKAK